MEKNKDAEKDIIEAARKVFITKGFSSATTRDIAKEANVNIAMVHYYYRSKENLFDIIFEEAFKTLISSILDATNSNIALFEKIELIIHNYINTLISNPYLPNFIVNEITQNPERIEKKFKDKDIYNKVFKRLSEDIENETIKGTIREINPISLFMNILSMCIFPFLAKPIFKWVFEFGESYYGELLEERKKIITEFVINAIKKC
ncbi:MAG: TetR/AcrR family transcriptional regulator [Bacteroidota bacterium]|nr:TetR/AcrR family transcriptional regulator [Bacteroidota bacterium]